MRSTPPPPFAIKGSRARRGVVDAFLGPGEGPLPPPMAAHSLCHEDCWQWRNLCGGKGRQPGHSRSVSQRTEPDPVRPSQHQLSVAQHRRHTLPIILCLFLTSISRDGSFTRRSSCAFGPHGTSIWQVSTHTSPLREAAWVPSRPWSGEHTCVAAWLVGDIYVLWIV